MLFPSALYSVVIIISISLFLFLNLYLVEPTLVLVVRETMPRVLKTH